MKVKQTEQKEIGRVKLGDAKDLVVSIVDDEKVDLRVFLNTDSYKGPTKRGVRFYMFDDNWEKFKEIMEKVDKVYHEIA